MSIQKAQDTAIETCMRTSFNILRLTVLSEWVASPSNIPERINARGYHASSRVGIIRLPADVSPIHINILNQKENFGGSSKNVMIEKKSVSGTMSYFDSFFIVEILNG